MVTSLKKLGLRALSARGVREAFRPWTHGRVPILMLHRFGTGDGGGVTGAALLEECARFLHGSGFRALTLGQLSEEIRRGVSISRSVCLTVDDGYRDFLDVAFPVLSRHGIPATVFVARDFIDGKNWYWWDRIDYCFRNADAGSVALRLGAAEQRTYRWSGEREKAAAQKSFTADCKRIPDEAKWEAIHALERQLGVGVPERPTQGYEPMSWEEIRRLRAAGIEFGGHTVTHPILSQLSPERAEAEIVESLDAIESNTGERPRTFAYPNGQPGDFTSNDMQVLEREGVLGAVTGEHGVVSRKLLRSLDKPLYRLPRVGMPPTLEGFIHVVSGVEALKQDLGYV